MITAKKFSHLLLDWYDHHGRKDLPWRQDITPYRVWVSEIMLQQTQVKTVIPYFKRFIENFPTLMDLANAQEDEVLHLWTGLGYYSRARNLHRAAKQLTAEYPDQFPTGIEQWQSLPGIGRSTAGAILSIGLNQPAPILDGNVRRILSRFHAIAGLTTQSHYIKQLWEIAQRYTPNSNRAADYAQAIMDLGATLCTRAKPQCNICPLKTHCLAHQQGREAEFPSVKPSKHLPSRAVKFLIFHHPPDNVVWLEKRPPIGVWGGLWSFPECPATADVEQWCLEQYGYVVKKATELKSIKHVFSHFQLQITPIHITHYQTKRNKRVVDSANRIWYNLTNSPIKLGFAKPIQGLLQQISTTTS